MTNVGLVVCQLRKLIVLELQVWTTSSLVDFVGLLCAADWRVSYGHITRKAVVAKQATREMEICKWRQRRWRLLQVCY